MDGALAQQYFVCACTATVRLCLPWRQSGGRRRGLRGRLRRRRLRLRVRRRRSHCHQAPRYRHREGHRDQGVQQDHTPEEPVAAALLIIVIAHTFSTASAPLPDCTTCAKSSSSGSSVTASRHAARKVTNFCLSRAFVPKSALFTVTARQARLPIVSVELLQHQSGHLQDRHAQRESAVLVSMPHLCGSQPHAVKHPLVSEQGLPFHYCSDRCPDDVLHGSPPVRFAWPRVAATTTHPAITQGA